MSTPARGTDSDYSKGTLANRVESFLTRVGIEPGYVAAVMLAVAGVAGPVLLVVGDFFPLYEVRTVAAQIPDGTITGGTNHLYSMVLLGLASGLMAYGAIRGGSRPAMIALASLGVVAAVVALGNDLPDATGESTLNRSYGYASATAYPKIGFYLETLGAALTIIAGVGALVLTGGTPRPPSGAEPGTPEDADSGRTRR
jgi:hypothetical protein